MPTGAFAGGFGLALYEVDKPVDIVCSIIHIGPVKFWRVCGCARVAASPAYKDLAVIFGRTLHNARWVLLLEVVEREDLGGTINRGEGVVVEIG